MRATYTNLPANYLTRYVFVERLQQQIDYLRNLSNPVEVPTVAKKNLSNETSYFKIGLLCLALVIFVVWRLMKGFSLPNTAANSSASSAAPVSTPATATPVAAKTDSVSATSQASSEAVYKATQTNDFIIQLLKNYRPRLSTTAYSPEIGFIGNIDFYDNYELIESYKITELHSLGVTLIRRPYGVDLVYDGKTFIVSSWKLPQVSASTIESPEPTLELVAASKPLDKIDKLL